MENNYVSPINGEKLELNSNGILVGQNTGINYIIKDNNIVPLKSPNNGAELMLGEDGLLYDNHSNTKYMLNESQEVVALESPQHGGELIKGEDGFYTSPYDQIKYVVHGDGRITPLLDPYSGSPLIPNEDGTFESMHTGKTFVYDETKEAAIPLYIPDETLESAHLENGMLVGDETGRKFEVDLDGRILTPEEISFKEHKEEELKRFDQMIENGEIENYLNNIELKKEKLGKLTEEKLSELVNQPTPIDDQKIVSNNIETDSKHITQTNMTVQDFLINNNINNEQQMANYLEKMGLDKNIIEIMGKANGTNFLGMLGKELDAPLSIIENKGSTIIYIPTIKEDADSNAIQINKDGSVRLIANNHSQEMIDGIRPGSVGIVDIKSLENGDLSCMEQHHQVALSTGLQPEGSKPRFEITSSNSPFMILSNGEFKADITTNKQTICESNSEGLMQSIDSSEYMQGKLTDLRNMGFDENYFNKEHIAGINIGKDGKNINYESEDLHNISEFGINEENFQHDIDPYGEYREQIAQYFNEKNEGESLHSDFTVQGDKCHHYLERITNGERNILQERDFEYNEQFKSGMLEPSITDYAERCPVAHTDVAEKEDGKANFNAISNDNNVISINNIETDYANIMASDIKQIEPQAMSQPQMTNNMEGPVLKKTMNQGPKGYIDTLVITLISGVTIGFILFVIYNLVY